MTEPTHLSAEGFATEIDAAAQALIDKTGCNLTAAYRQAGIDSLDAARRELAEAKANERGGWELAHSPNQSCGHPRACWQDRNYPLSETNYDFDKHAGDPPLDYHCLMCDAISDERKRVCNGVREYLGMTRTQREYSWHDVEDALESTRPAPPSEHSEGEQ